MYFFQFVFNSRIKNVFHNTTIKDHLKKFLQKDEPLQLTVAITKIKKAWLLQSDTYLDLEARNVFNTGTISTKLPV